MVFSCVEMNWIAVTVQRTTYNVWAACDLFHFVYDSGSCFSHAQYTRFHCDCVGFFFRHSDVSYLFSVCEISV